MVRELLNADFAITARQYIGYESDTGYHHYNVDAFGKHPWKAEGTEDDAGVAASVITDWYKQVYEPVKTADASGGNK